MKNIKQFHLDFPICPVSGGSISVSSYSTSKSTIFWSAYKEFRCITNLVHKMQSVKSTGFKNKTKTLTHTCTKHTLQPTMLFILICRYMLFRFLFCRFLFSALVFDYRLIKMMLCFESFFDNKMHSVCYRFGLIWFWFVFLFRLLFSILLLLLLTIYFKLIELIFVCDDVDTISTMVKNKYTMIEFFEDFRCKKKCRKRKLVNIVWTTALEMILKSAQWNRNLDDDEIAPKMQKK